MVKQFTLFYYQVIQIFKDLLENINYFIKVILFYLKDFTFFLFIANIIKMEF